MIRHSRRAGLTDVLVAALGALAVLHPALSGKVPAGHVVTGPPLTAQLRTDHTPALSDLAMAILPNLAFDQRELAAGRVPLWNPYQGAGVPHLGNQQSAPLHPFTLAGLLAPWRSSLAIIVVLRLFLVYAGTLLLARELDIGQAGARFAALSHALSGASVAWLAHPVGGVLGHLPLLAALTLRCAKRKNTHGLALTLALASSILTGHLEYLPVVWGIIAGVATISAGRRSAALARVVASMAAASALGAVMLLPCAEYLAESSRLRDRQGGTSPHLLEGPVLAAAVDPMLSRPSISSPFVARGISPMALASVYVGTLVLPLAAAGCRGRGVRLLALLLVAVIGISSGPAGRVLWSVPPLSLMQADRLTSITSLLVSLLAGMGIEALAAGTAMRSMAIAGAALPVAILVAEPWLAPEAAGLALPVRILGATGALLSAAACLARRGRRHQLGLLIAALLLERGLALGRFHCWEPPERLYPVTRFLEALAAEQGHDRVTGLGSTLTPNAATCYGLRDLRSYDGLGIARHDRALAEEGNRDFMGWPRVVPSAYSRAGAARILLLPEPAQDTDVAQLDVSVSTPFLRAGMEVAQPLRAPAGIISAIGVYRRASPVHESARLRVELRREGADGGTLFSTSGPARASEDGWATWPVAETIALAAPTHLRLVLALEDAIAGDALAFGAAPRSRGPRLLAGGKPLPLGLAFRLEYGLPRTAPVVARTHGLSARQDDAALPRARLLSRPADPRLVAWEADDPTHVALRIDASGSDRLLLADTAYPGWIATCDGRPLRVQREGPFRSVDVPPGSHRVGFRYRPQSYAIGLFLSSMAALALALLGAGRRRGDRRSS